MLLPRLIFAPSPSLRSITRVATTASRPFASEPLSIARSSSRSRSAQAPTLARLASSCCGSSTSTPPSSNPHKSQNPSSSFTTTTPTANYSTSAPPSPFTFKMSSSDNSKPPSAEEVSKYLRETHDRLFDNNRAWAAEKAEKDPGYFAKLSAGQSPEYLWIGCSDSRIPAEQITGLEPGEAFIHRNIANLVCNTDLNVMSVINYAVRHLGVKHIIVCGHYGCGGVKAAMTPKDLGLLNPWLRNIRDVYRLHEAELDAIPDEEQRYNRLVELNVEEQCRNIVKTAAVQQSYAKNQFPVVHGWVFGFHDGLLKDLKIDFQAMLQNIQKIYNLTDAE